ncbi:hypothetical protein [uncultured Shewanella sp.]|uniref:hypothetical protein n=1 Tax=uncultured Shewanella sp. TaxID=173975 RepID=UPI0026301BB8|nr:hypothetical protein [uncultured Shewanella sp.]
MEAAAELYSSEKHSVRGSRHLESLGGAGIDAFLALERFVAFIEMQNKLTRAIQTPVISIGKEWIMANTKTGTVLNRLGIQLVGKISVGYALGVVSGAITVDIYIKDMLNELDQGDTAAAIANGVAAFFASIATGSLALGLIGMGFAGPVVLVLFLLGGIAAGVAVWLDSNDIELLLINGPLGLTPNKARYGHLHQTDEAYYRLVSYLNQPRLELKQLSDQDLRQLQPFLTESGFSQDKIPNRQINVNTQFPSWFTLNDFRVRVRLIKETRQQSNKTGEFYLVKVEEVANFIPYYQPTSQGLDILLHKPSGGIQKAGLLGSVISVQYRVQLKLQMIAIGAQEKSWIFPAPDIETAGSFTEDFIDSEFDNSDQDFWLFKEWV